MVNRSFVCRLAVVRSIIYRLLPCHYRLDTAGQSRVFRWLTVIVGRVGRAFGPPTMPCTDSMQWLYSVQRISTKITITAVLPIHITTAASPAYRQLYVHLYSAYYSRYCGRIAVSGRLLPARRRHCNAWFLLINSICMFVSMSVRLSKSSSLKKKTTDR